MSSDMVWQELPRRNMRARCAKLSRLRFWFEEVASGGQHKQLKQSIADDLRIRVAPNKHHKDLMALNFQHILTTNYDYNLEAADGGSWISNFPARETFYSLFRRRSSGNRHVWHIHGELDIVGSIMLGHEQYSGYIHKIKNFLSSGVETDAKDRNGKAYIIQFLAEQ